MEGEGEFHVDEGIRCAGGALRSVALWVVLFVAAVGGVGCAQWPGVSVDLHVSVSGSDGTTFSKLVSNGREAAPEE